MALRTFIDVGLVAELTSPIDLQERNAPGRLRRVLSWVDADADLFWADRRTLAASATEDLDLDGGGLVDAFGQALAFARITALFVVTGANRVHVIRPAANGVPIFLAAGDGVEVRPNSPLALVANDGTGYPVTAGTGDLITLTNPDGAASTTFDIAIVGRSS